MRPVAFSLQFITWLALIGLGGLAGATLAIVYAVSTWAVGLEFGPVVALSLPLIGMLVGSIGASFIQARGAW